MIFWGAAAAAITVVIAMTAGCTAAPVPIPSAVETMTLDARKTAWERAERTQVQDGGVLRLAVAALPSNFNPFRSLRTERDTSDILAATLGGPFRIDESGAPVLDENYASSAEVLGDDPQVVAIHLNPDAVWEDGTPITVADYAATWRATNGSNEAYEPVSTTGWDHIESIEAGDDPHHVVVTFSRGYADWQGLFTSVLKESVASDPAVFNDGFLTSAMPSAGPFTITGVDTTGKVVTAERNPLWWGEAPKLDRILLQAVSPDQQGLAFANGEIDALSLSPNVDLYETARAVEGADIQATVGLAWTHVTLNASHGPLADVNVRRAVASVVDREQIAAWYAPLGFPPVTQGDYIFLAGQDGYVDAAPPHDPEAGAEFLEEAGYGKEGDEWVRDGEVLELSVTVPADAEADIRRAEQVQADLGEFGIPVDIVTVPAAGYFSDHVIAGDFEMVTFSWVGTAFPISSAESLFHPLDSKQNFTGTTDEALGHLWGQAKAELDPEARAEIAHEINEVIWDYVPMFPIAPVPEVWAVAEGLVNFGARQFESVDWTVVGWAAEQPE